MIRCVYDLDAANLNFSQKLKMLKSDHAFQFVNFHQGITIINKIRNKYSHYLEAKIEASEIGILNSILIDYSDKVEGNRFNISNKATNEVTVIEEFTEVFCAFLAGYCSSLVEGWKL